MNVIAIGSILQKQRIGTNMESTATSYSQANSSTDTDLALISTKSIEWLWTQLTNLYGKPFLIKHGAHDNHGTWFLTLRGLTTKALESGMERLRDLSNGGKFAEYAPNSLEFKALCLSFYDDLGLPSPSTAFREIQNTAYGTRRIQSHKLVQFMASRLPSDFLKIEDEASAWALFKPAYDQVCNLVKQGHAIPDVCLTHVPAMQLKQATGRDVAHRHLAAMKQRLGA